MAAAGRAIRDSRRPARDAHRTRPCAIVAPGLTPADAEQGHRVWMLGSLRPELVFRRPSLEAFLLHSPRQRRGGACAGRPHREGRGAEARIDREVSAGRYAWLDWLTFLEEMIVMDVQPSEADVDEFNDRVKARDDSYRQLVLLASDPLHEWLTGTYNDLEYQLKATYVRQVRSLQAPDPAAADLRREFSRVIRVDLIARLRPEVATLRDPTRSQRGLLRRGR